MLGQTQRRCALIVGVKAGGIDQDFSADVFGRTGFQLQISIDAFLPGFGDFFNTAADLEKRKTGIGVKCDTG